MVDFACKDCGALMSYIENSRKNEFYFMKVDTWKCNRCNRLVEEPRLNKELNYK